MQERPELTSWKQIAERLDVSVRTAQEWERRRGLPIRRVPGSRGRVFARVDEIEEWLFASDPRNGDVPAASRLGQAPRGRRAWAIPIIAIAAIAALAVALGAGQSDAPTQARVVGNSLQALAPDGQILWSVSPDGGFREDTYTDTRYLPLVADLDGDVRAEVLLIHAPADPAASDLLIAYSADGSELWRFESAGQFHTEVEEFSATRRIGTVRVGDFGKAGIKVIVVSRHFQQYPTEISVLGADGVLERRFLHPGYVGVERDQLAIGDPDGDGRTSIYAAGVNNARERATLLVLDPEVMGGATIESVQEYQLLTDEPGAGYSGVVFPRTGVSRYGDRYNAARGIVLRPGTITLTVVEELGTGAAIMWELDGGLNALSASPSDTFAGAHRRLRNLGALATQLDEEVDPLRDAIVRIGR